METEEWSLPAAGDAIGFVRLPGRLAARPALLIHLTLTARQGLDNSPYSIPTNAFLAAGHAVASFDLPHHGRLRDTLGDGLDGWAAAFAAGHRVFDRAIATGSALIDAWFERTSPSGPVLIAGVSRGALVAFHLYAADARIAAAAGFAPVTDLLALREFAALSGSARVHEANALALAPRLRDRPLLMTINEADERVDTAACIAFFDALGGASHPRPHRLRIDPGSGHTVPDAAYHDGANWLLGHAAPT